MSVFKTADEFLLNLDVEKSFLTMMQNSVTINKKTDEFDYMKKIYFMIKKISISKVKKKLRKQGT